MSCEVSFITKVWDSLKRLFDPYWMVTNTMLGGALLLVIILFKYLMQHLPCHSFINKTTFLVLWALECHEQCSTTIAEVIKA